MKHFLLFILLICSQSLIGQHGQLAHLIVQDIQEWQDRQVWTQTPWEGNICQEGDFELVYEENFDGTSLNDNDWFTYFPKSKSNLTDQHINGRTHAENECQVYLDENVEVSNGTLKLIAKEEQATWFGKSVDHTSGVIFSKNTFGYGKYEARIKYPSGKGFFPAFWLLALSKDTEIDIFEIDGDNWNHHRFGNINWKDPTNPKMHGTEYEDTSLSDEFHVWTVVYDPYKISFFVDGEFVYDIYKYRKTNSQVPNCELNFQVYLEDVSFPTPNEPLRIIVNLAMCGISEPPNGSTVFPNNVEVDYIKYYKRNQCYVSYDNILNVDESIILTSDLSLDGIFIADGKSLTIKNATIEFSENAILKIGEGSRLELDNAILTNCEEEKWQGIETEGDPRIEINQSVIENANIGLTIGNSTNFPPFLPSSTNSELEIINGSEFKNCNVGLILERGETDGTISGNTSFIDNGTGIIVNENRGLVIDDTQFLNNNRSIRVLESYVNIRDGNVFNGDDIAVSVLGTFPLSTGVDIGDAGAGFNLFENNDKAILALGNESPAGTNIVNCNFVNSSTYAVDFGGATDYRFMNNNIHNSQVGLVSWASGDNFNDVNCNIIDYVSTTGSAMAFLLDNQETTFLENQFTGTQNAMINTVNAILPQNIGSGLEAAANCFADAGFDINTQDIPDLASLPWPPGESFNYHYFDDSGDMDCQEPINSGNYNKLGAFISDGNCEGAVGIFNLIDPSPGTGIASVYHEHYDPDNVCTGCIQDSVAHWIDAVVQIGGDDPRTVVDEEVPSNDPVRPLFEETMT